MMNKNSKDRQGRRTRRTGYLLGCAALSLVLADGGATAQTASSRTYSIDIAAQPLPQAIASLSAQTGLQVLYTGNQAFRHVAHAVNGKLTPEQALARMLQGSGLSYHVVRPNAVTLDTSTADAPASADATELAPLVVQGHMESPYGPGKGYVATTSATGTKTNTPLIETPQSISVVTRKQMDDQQPTSVNEALRYTPGVIPEIYGVESNRVSSSINLRSFNADTYLDGLSGPVIDPYLLDRLETLSGPDSVLYGQATPGGLVNMVSKRPTDTPSHEIFVGVGNDKRIETGFDFSGPIDKDGQFLYRLTGIGFDRDTQTDFVKANRIGIAPAITWQPDGDTSLTVLGKYVRDPDVGAALNVPAYGTILPNPNGTIPRSFFVGDPNYFSESQTQASVGYQLDHSFDNVWSIHQRVRYSSTSKDSIDLFSSSLSSDLSTYNRYAFPDLFNEDTIQVDNNVEANFDTGALRHDIIAGLDYRHTLDKYKYGFNFSVPSIDIFDPVYGVTIPSIDPGAWTLERDTTSQLGLYAQDQIKLDNWSFVIGGRQDWARSASSSTSYGVTSATDQDDRHFSWRTGLVYQFDNGIAPYASYSTSFKPQVGTSAGGGAFKPLTGAQYEVGVKYQPPGAESFVTAAVYDLTEHNVNTTDPDNPALSIQTGEIRAKGVELQAHASLTDELSLIGTYTYTDAENTSTNNTATGIDGATVSTQGKRPFSVPTQMASLWTDYTFHSGKVQGLGLGAGVRYVGSSYGDGANSFKVPAFTLVDVGLHYDLGASSSQLKGWNVAVTASNLFNKKYVSSCTTANFCYFGVGRLVYGTLKYSW